MQNPAPTKRERTYKRETAIGCLVFLAALAIFAVASADPAVIKARTELVGVLAFPVFLFAVGAFGMDAASKQLGFGRPAQGVYDEGSL